MPRPNKKVRRRIARAIGLYRLVGQTPVPCDDVLEWAAAFECEDRRVKQTRIGPFAVSTIFLGLNHNWFGGPPLLFETRTFVSQPFESVDYNEHDGRWATWAEAEAAHDTAVAYLKATYCADNEEPVDITGQEPIA